MKSAAVLFLSLLAAGCNLYSHNSGDDVCAGGAYNGGAGVAELDTRDPTTGICTYTTTGGGDCDPDNNGCCVAVPVSEPAMQVGATCNGACEGLDENTCLATAGCHADYEAQPTELGALPNVFAQCWDIEPLAPLEGGDCTQLDAYTCAQHDDCISVMDGIAGEDNSQYGYFQACAPESGAPNQCDGVVCGSGSTCEVVCEPVACPAGSDSSTCMSECAAECEPGAPTVGSCTGTVTCNIVAPTCPANTVPGIDNGCWTGYCIPKADCTSPDPGSCEGSVTCNSAPPPCPSNSLPGIGSNGCWSGFCIPESDCPAQCAGLTTEAACDARSDCESVFDGQNCTCDNSGCTCESETWAACEESSGGTGGGSGVGSGGGGGSGVNPGGPVMPAFVVRIH